MTRVLIFIVCLAVFSPSTSFAQQWNPQMDFNQDRIVNHLDLLLFMQAWLTRAPEDNLPSEVLEQLAGNYSFIANGSELEPDDPSPVNGILVIESNGTARIVFDESTVFAFGADPGGQNDFSAEGTDGEALVGMFTDTGFTAELTITENNDTDRFSLDLVRQQSFNADTTGIWVVDSRERFSAESSVLEEDLFFLSLEEQGMQDGLTRFSIQDLALPIFPFVDALATGNTLVAYFNSEGERIDMGIRFDGSSFTGIVQSSQQWAELAAERIQPAAEPDFSGLWVLQLTQLIGPDTGLVETLPGIQINQNGNQISARAGSDIFLQGVQYGNAFKVVATEGDEELVELFGRVVSPTRIEGYLREDRSDEYLYSRAVLTR